MQQAPDPNISQTLAKAVRAMHARHSLDETLDTIVRVARDTVPGFNHVGISVVESDGTIETKAATDQFVFDNDDLQYELGEGPCMQAMAGDGLVMVERACQEARWPAYMHRAVQMGLKSQMGLQLYDEQGTLGGLNLYSTEQETIDVEAPGIADLFAAHAAIALGHVREVSQLREALSTRQIIGQATGVVMERYDLSEDRAFHYLVRVSSTSNVKLRDVAMELIRPTAATSEQ